MKDKTRKDDKYENSKDKRHKKHNIFLKNPAAQQDLDLFLCCQLSLKMIYAVPENLHRIAPAAPDNLEYDRELMTIL